MGPIRPLKLLPKALIFWKVEVVWARSYLVPKFLYYNTMKSIWNMMNVWNLVFNYFKMTLRINIWCIRKSVNSYFQKYHHISGTFHCNVTKEFRNKWGSCQDHKNWSKIKICFWILAIGSKWDPKSSGRFFSRPTPIGGPWASHWLTKGRGGGTRDEGRGGTLS